MAVARQSFLIKGYAATTMSSIAGVMGGSKSTLWSYFSSKEELFAEVIEHAIQQYRAELSSLLENHGKFVPILYRFCRRYLTKLVSSDALALHRLIVAEASRFPEIGEIFHQRGPALTQQMLSDFLSDAMDRNEITRCDPTEAARVLLALCLTGSHNQLLLGRRGNVSERQIEDDVEFAMRVFLRAYAFQLNSP